MTLEPKKILIVSANPKNTPPLRLDEERKKIKEGLRAAAFRENYKHRNIRSIDIRNF